MSGVVAYLNQLGDVDGGGGGRRGSTATGRTSSEETPSPVSVRLEARRSP